MKIIFFRNEIIYDHGEVRWGYPSSGKEDFWAFWEWMALQQAAVYGRRGRSKKKGIESRLQMFTQKPQFTSVISGCGEYFNKSAVITSFLASCFTPVLSSSFLVLLPFMPALSSSSPSISPA